MWALLLLGGQALRLDTAPFSWCLAFPCVSNQLPHASLLDAPLYFYSTQRNAMPGWKANGQNVNSPHTVNAVMFTLQINPYIKLLPMLAGIGSPGTVQEVRRSSGLCTGGGLHACLLALAQCRR